MKLIDEPKNLAERIVNAVMYDLYDRNGFDDVIDGIPEDVRQEMATQLTAVVQEELDHVPR